MIMIQLKQVLGNFVIRRIIFHHVHLQLLAFGEPQKLIDLSWDHIAQQQNYLLLKSKIQQQQQNQQKQQSQPKFIFRRDIIVPFLELNRDIELFKFFWETYQTDIIEWESKRLLDGEFNNIMNEMCQYNLPPLSLGLVQYMIDHCKLTVGNRLLKKACKDGNTELVQWIIDNIDITKLDCRDLVYLSCSSYNCLNIIMKNNNILQQSLFKSQSVKSTLRILAQLGHKETFDYIWRNFVLNQESKAQQESLKNSCSILGIASLNGDHEMVDYLIVNGFMVSSKELNQIAIKGDFYIVDSILKNQPNIKIMALSDKEQPIWINSLEIVKLLFSHMVKQQKCDNRLKIRIIGSWLKSLAMNGGIESFKYIVEQSEINTIPIPFEIFITPYKLASINGQSEIFIYINQLYEKHQQQEWIVQTTLPQLDLIGIVGKGYIDIVKNILPNRSYSWSYAFKKALWFHHLELATYIATVHLPNLVQKKIGYEVHLDRLVTFENRSTAKPLVDYLMDKSLLLQHQTYMDPLVIFDDINILDRATRIYRSTFKSLDFAARYGCLNSLFFMWETRQDLQCSHIYMVVKNAFYYNQPRILNFLTTQPVFQSYITQPNRVTEMKYHIKELPNYQIGNHFDRFYSIISICFATDLKIKLGLDKDKGVICRFLLNCFDLKSLSDGQMVKVITTLFNNYTAGGITLNIQKLVQRNYINSLKTILSLKKMINVNPSPKELINTSMASRTYDAFLALYEFYPNAEFDRNLAVTIQYLPKQEEEGL